MNRARSVINNFFSDDDMGREVKLALVCPRGHQGRAPPLNPISFIFMQFSEKTLPNNRFLPQTQGVDVSVWEILDQLLISYIDEVQRT